MRLRSMESRHDSPVSAVCVVPSGVKCNPSILTISNVSSEVRKLTNLDDSVVYEPWQITSISLSSSLWVQESTFTFRRKCPNSQAEKQLWASMHFVCNFLEINWQTWHATKKTTSIKDLSLFRVLVKTTTSIHLHSTLLELVSNWMAEPSHGWILFLLFSVSIFARLT